MSVAAQVVWAIGPTGLQRADIPVRQPYVTDAASAARAQYGSVVPPRVEYVNPLTGALPRVGAWLRQHPQLADGVMFLAEQLA